MYGRPFRLALVLAALAGVLPPARAIMPRTYTDVELANWPIIVVGYWPKAEVKPHTKGTNNSWEKWEFHTRLVVTRVIRGRLGVGNHHLLFDFGIGWNKEGKDVSSASSTLIPGDVDDVSKPCIWFLEWARSWDSADPAWYLHVRQFQCVQETRLARYFEILRHADRNTAITECLASADPKVAERAVRYVVGPGPLWPETAIDGGAPGIRHVSSNVPEHSLPRYIPFLRRIARSNKARTPEVAAAALAAVAGRAALPDLRRLAQAKNLAVAAVATAYLIHYHDWDDVKLIRSGIYRAYASPRAPANGFDEVGYTLASLGSETARELERSPSSSAIPLLIVMLDCGLSGGSVSTRDEVDVDEPRLWAQRALKQRTGVSFPFDSQESLAAWRAVAGISDPTDRTTQLQKILGNWDAPLQAWIEPGAQIASGSPIHATQPAEPESTITITVRNIGDRSITLEKWPGAESSSANGGGTISPATAVKSEVVTLAPGQTLSTRWLIYSIFLTDPNLKVMLSFGPGKVGAHCWTGSVRAERRTPSGKPGAR